MKPMNSIKPPIYIKDVLDSALDTIDQRFADKQDSAILTFGVDGLDKQTLGIPSTGLTVITSKIDSFCKKLAINIIAGNALNEKTVGVVSPLNDMTDYGFQLISNVANVSLANIVTGDLGEDDWPKLTDAIARLNLTQISFNKTHFSSVKLLCSYMLELKRLHGVELVVIDNLHVFKKSIVKVMRRLRLFSQDNNLAIVALHIHTSKKDLIKNGLFQYSNLLLSVKNQDHRESVTILKNTLLFDEQEFNMQISSLDD
jgi:replicative DNA helicase